MRHLMPMVAACATIVSATSVHARTGDQLFKLLPDDGAAGDRFGDSVGVSGPIAIVGAAHNDDACPRGPHCDSGSAYLFDTTTGMQLAKLLPTDGAQLDQFGGSVAISGATAIVGADHDQDNGLISGSAYLFDTTTGMQLAKLLPTDGAQLDQFGFSVAVSGANAIVGSYRDDDNGSDSGSAYLFDTTTGMQLAKLLPTDGAANDHFGYSVAISGSIAIVGAPFDDDNEHSSGSAYLFDTTTGMQLAKLLPMDGAVDDLFGWSVAVSGATAIVGSYLDDDNGIDSGSAYLFDTTAGMQIAKLLPMDGVSNNRFGLSVAISGSIAIVGTVGAGSAYLFDTTTGMQLAELLLPTDGAQGAQFGLSVAVSGATAIVGAPSDDDNGHSSGSAYLFCSGIASSACPADTDNNCKVDVDDLVTVLLAWGTDDPWADVNGDGTVNVDDLVELILAWGPC